MRCANDDFDYGGGTLQVVFVLPSLSFSCCLLETEVNIPTVSNQQKEVNKFF
jgi:hypothetical protein